MTGVKLLELLLFGLQGDIVGLVFSVLPLQVSVLRG